MVGWQTHVGDVVRAAVVHDVHADLSAGVLLPRGLSLGGKAIGRDEAGRSQLGQQESLGGGGHVLENRQHYSLKHGPSR